MSEIPPHQGRIKLLGGANFHPVHIIRGVVPNNGTFGGIIFSGLVEVLVHG